MGVTARRIRLRSDFDDFEALAQLVGDQTVVAFLIEEKIVIAALALKQLPSAGETSSCEQRRQHAALRGETDTKPLGQRRRNRAVAGKRNAAIGDPQRIGHAGCVETENFAASHRCGKWAKRDGLSMNRLRISR